MERVAINNLEKMFKTLAIAGALTMGAGFLTDKEDLINLGSGVGIISTMGAIISCKPKEKSNYKLASRNYNSGDKK
jgi:hypothetical protein